MVGMSEEQVVKVRSDLLLTQQNMAVFSEMLTELTPGKEHPQVCINPSSISNISPPLPSLSNIPPPLLISLHKEINSNNKNISEYFNYIYNFTNS